VRRKSALRSRVTRVRVGPRARRVSWQRGSLHDSGIPNLKLNSAMKEFLAGSRTNRLPCDSPVASGPIPLCPICVLPRSTVFDFLSFFNVPEQPFVRAIFLLSYCWSCMFLRFAATCVS